MFTITPTEHTMRHGFTLIELMIVIAIIAIIAAIAIPNLMESRVTANEAAASASLKSGIFPAQVSFQSGSYQDLDADNVGEYATLGALAGRIPTNKIGSNSIKLLQGPLATNTAWSGGSAGVPITGAPTAPAVGSASGYKFAAWTPADTTSADLSYAIWAEGNAAPDTLIAANANGNANNGEKYWVVGCAPDKFGDTGRRAFVISQDGQVRTPAKAVGINAFFNSAGTAPANGNAVTAALLSQGVVYGYSAAYTAGTACSSVIAMALTTFDGGATLVYEVNAK